VLNAQSRSTTSDAGTSNPGPDTSARLIAGPGLQPWMMPLILEDIVKGKLAQTSATSLGREVALLRFRRSADSSIIAGLKLSEGQSTRRIDVLQDSASRGWQMAGYWKGRYKKASAERWLWRLGKATEVFIRFRYF